MRLWGPSTVPLACTPCGGCVPQGWWGAVPWWPATDVRGVWCPWARSLPRSPVLWGRQPGFRDPYAPGAVGAGTGTWHRPHSARPCELAWHTVGVAEWRPQGGAVTVVRGVSGQAPPLSQLPALRAGCRGSSSTCCGRGCAGVGVCNKVGHNTQTDRQTERILCSAVAELSAELIQTDRQTDFSVPQSPKSQSRQ